MKNRFQRTGNLNELLIGSRLFFRVHSFDSRSEGDKFMRPPAIIDVIPDLKRNVFVFGKEEGMEALTIYLTPTEIRFIGKENNRFDLAKHRRSGR